MRFAALLALCLAAAPLATPAVAQPMPNMSHPDPAVDSQLMEMMNKMNRGMTDMAMTGDADHDFAAMMIPHHQGAIDMAKFELAHGKDPALRKIAQDIIKSQEKEIAQFKAWLKKHQ